MKKILHSSKFSTALILFIIFFPLRASAKGDVSILRWQEDTTLTESGKNSEILIEGKTRDFSPNQVMTAFSISFDPKREIKITKVMCDGRHTDYSFNNNSLKVKFPQEKSNNKTLAIAFSFEEKYDQIGKYLRHELIDIPAFAAGAEAKIVINFPGFLESATLNPNVTKSGSSFIYSNIVGKDGVREILKLTPTSSSWNIVIKVKVNADRPLSNATIFLPTYFQNGGQKIQNVVTTSSVAPIKQELEGTTRNLKFNTSETEILIENRAKISTGKNNRMQIMRNAASYLSYSGEEFRLLSPILERIKQDAKYRELPLHAKIGKFVHDFIRYDANYTGKLPSIREILQNPVGVCTEYSELYTALARIAGIPALSVDGGACGEYESCQGHAWNMIYLNGRWVDVDATWDLMSGVVSSSHVYFNESGKGDVAVQYFSNRESLESVRSKMDFEMKLVEQN